MHDHSVSQVGIRQRRGYLIPFMVISLLVCFAATGILMMTRPTSLISARTFFSDTIASVFSSVDNFLSTGRETFYAITHFMQREQDLQKLREENADFLKWRHIATKLYAENDSLKKLLQFAPEGRHDFLTARCLTISQDSLKTALLNVGAEQHVNVGDIVLGKQGVLGRIINTSATTSRVLMIHDPTSKIPVHVEGKNISALVAGGYADKLKLLYVPQASPLTVGDRLVTSNEGDIFPTGFYVGSVQSIHGDDVEVKAAESGANIDFVMVLRQAGS